MREKQSYNNDLLRLKNRGQVFEQLVRSDGIYRMDLVERCGLTKMSISNIIAEFLEKNIAVETEKSEEKRPGRKSTMLHLSPKAKKLVGLLIHRKFISAVLCDCKLNVIRANTVRFDECTSEFLVEKSCGLIDEMMAGEDILGIGVGSIGPVNVNDGIILNPPEFYGIHDVPIVQILKERYNLPVHLDYHYNSAARAEKYFGFGKNYSNFIFLGITEGLGLASVVDGKILTRMIGTSSEFGHMLVDYNGPQCFCGRRGCLGTYMDFTTEESAWESVRILSAALAGVCDVLVPSAIIIRDENSCLKQEHFEWMKQELNQKIIVRDYHAIDVLPSYRSKELEAAGCAANVLGRIFGGEIEI